MKFKFLFLFILFFLLNVRAQEITCENSFTRDTVSIPGQTEVMEGEALKTVLKKLSEVQLYAINRNKYYVRLYVTENFYFNKVDVLEVESGSKSYYVKNCKQHKISKTMGMYVFEVQKNYLGTLRDEGITGLIFAGAETKFTKSDAQHIKKITRCFYETMFGKK